MAGIFIYEQNKIVNWKYPKCNEFSYIRETTEMKQDLKQFVKQNGKTLNQVAAFSRDFLMNAIAGTNQNDHS